MVRKKVSHSSVSTDFISQIKYVVDSLHRKVYLYGLVLCQLNFRYYDKMPDINN